MAMPGNKTKAGDAKSGKPLEVRDATVSERIRLAFYKAIRYARLSLHGLATASLDSVAIGMMQAPRRTDSVCIIRIDAIGDFVLWLESVKRLRLHYLEQGVKVILIANAAWASWARGLDLADEVWELNPVRFHRQYLYRIKWLRKVHAAGFSKAIHPVCSRWFSVGDSLVKATGAPSRLGASGDCTSTLPWLKKWADAWYTQLIDCGGESRMELLRNADFMRGLGFTDFKADIPKIPDSAGPALIQLTGLNYAVLVPGASWIGRSWPVASFAEIGRRLRQRGMDLVIVGGPGDRPRTEALLQELDNRALDLAGQTSLADLASVLRGARIVLSNETGPAHIAAACSAPLVCILGGGHFGRFMPYEVEVSVPSLPLAVFKKLSCFGCNWACKFTVPADGTVLCISEVAAEQVWGQIEALCEQREVPGFGAIAASPPSRSLDYT